MRIGSSMIRRGSRTGRQYICKNSQSFEIDMQVRVHDAAARRQEATADDTVLKIGDRTPGQANRGARTSPGSQAPCRAPLPCSCDRHGGYHPAQTHLRHLAVSSLQRTIHRNKARRRFAPTVADVETGTIVAVLGRGPVPRLPHPEPWGCPSGVAIHLGRAKLLTSDHLRKIPRCAVRPASIRFQRHSSMLSH